MNTPSLSKENLDSILTPCRQCGTCCKRYSKIALQQDEVDRIRRLGGHVGIDMTLADYRDGKADEVVAQKRSAGQSYMIHPDSKGCVFLEKRNDKYCCKIYHYRPRICRGFKCNLSDNTVEELFFDNPIHLLGMDTLGRRLDDN